MKYLLIFLLVSCSQVQNQMPHKQTTTKSFEIKDPKITVFELYY